MSMVATHLWHKPSSRAAWMRRFVIVSDSAIRIYGTRDDHEQHHEAMYCIELLTTTSLIAGSDNIVFQGWLTKKGQIQWNLRWCVLVKYGFLNYIDAELKQEIRSLDISRAKLLQIDDKHHAIRWKDDKGELLQFRCDSASVQATWKAQLAAVQATCLKLRVADQMSKTHCMEPTLFAFTVRKPKRIQMLSESEKADAKAEGDAFEWHFFCADNVRVLEAWKMSIAEQIHLSSDASRTHQESEYLRRKLKQNKHLGGDKNNKRHVSTMGAPIGTSERKSHRKSSFNFDFNKYPDLENLGDAEVERRMVQLMDKLKIPEHARSKLLSLEYGHKVKMLEQHAIKARVVKKKSGRAWSDKFASYKGTDISQLQQFSVVLRDEDDSFVLQFIESLGLNHLCRLAIAMKSTSTWNCCAL